MMPATSAVSGLEFHFRLESEPLLMFYRSITQLFYEYDDEAFAVVVTISFNEKTGRVEATVHSLP
jgi:hypothetical protein